MWAVSSIFHSLGRLFGGFVGEQTRAWLHSKPLKQVLWISGKWGKACHMKAPFSRCKLALTPHDHSGAQSLQPQPKFYGHHFKCYKSKTWEKDAARAQSTGIFFSLCRFMLFLQKGWKKTWEFDFVDVFWYEKRNDKFWVYFFLKKKIFETHVIKYSW